MKYERKHIQLRSGIRAGGKSEECKQKDYPYKDGSGRCVFKDDLGCCSQP